jgi:hypothetical protein
MVAARKDAIRDLHEVPHKSGPSESAKMRGVMSLHSAFLIHILFKGKE